MRHLRKYVAYITGSRPYAGVLVITHMGHIIPHENSFTKFLHSNLSATYFCDEHMRINGIMYTKTNVSVRFTATDLSIFTWDTTRCVSDNNCFATLQWIKEHAGNYFHLFSIVMNGGMCAYCNAD